MLTINKNDKTWRVKEPEPAPDSESGYKLCECPLVPKQPKKHPRRVPYDVWYRENKTTVDTVVKKLLNSITEAQFDYQDATVNVCVAVEKTVDDLYKMVYETSYNSLK